VFKPLTLVTNSVRTPLSLQVYRDQRWNLTELPLYGRPYESLVFRIIPVMAFSAATEGDTFSYPGLGIPGLIAFVTFLWLSERGLFLMANLISISPAQLLVCSVVGCQEPLGVVPPLCAPTVR
jgi:hypothetical protein